MAFNPAVFPARVDVMDYNLSLSTTGVEQSLSRFPSSLLEEAVGERFWRIAITICGRKRADDKAFSVWMASLAGRVFRLPHATLDSNLSIAVPANTQIISAEQVGARIRYTLSSAPATDKWIGRMLEINSRSVIVAAQAGHIFEAYPVIPLPTLPYTLPEAGGLRLRIDNGYFPHLTANAIGVEKTIIDCVEVPE